MMKLCYLRAKRAGWGGAAIDAFSGFGGACHVELEFSAGDTLRAAYGEAVSISVRDHAGPDWVIEELPDVTELEEAIVRAWAQREVGSPYDKWGVARFVLPFVRQSPTAWFCSELCVAALQRVNRLITVDAWRVSPNALRRLDKGPQYFLGYPAP